MQDPESGKEFSPSEHTDDPDRASASPGGGKQFAPDVKDPEHNAEARSTEGSGKEFSPEVQDPEDEDEAAGRKGSGKQFEPGRHEL
jgi:hypothetical protein